MPGQPPPGQQADPQQPGPRQAAPQRLALPGRPDRERGVHRVFIGMAAGVGKTCRALNELRDRLERGEDALIGILETHGRAGTALAAQGLPVFARRAVPGTTDLSELDLEGLLDRRPQVVLIDELAHTNAPGSTHAKRWQDVNALLDAGITVLSTVNVQHLESLNDTVARLTGVRVRERIPDTVLREATELILVDLTPHDLRARLRAGQVYSPDRAELALTNFFTSPNLTALREIALRQVASVVEHAPQAASGAREVVIVAVTATEGAARLIRRGGQLAARLHAPLHVVTVRGVRISAPESRLLDTYRALTGALGGQFDVIGPADVATALIAHANQVQATQIVMGESRRSRWSGWWRGDIIHRVLSGTRDVDVHIISRD
ncbi:universal stress protein [Deinococcus knuensis]|uniref:universal stress protein n=1 Tax=Deinococcus knuensis TaxID=1837380 RepID=UPI0027E55250|nr:universal stress protein [Deinococcus knuensis]